MSKLNPIVAMTSGSTPVLRSRFTSASLTTRPRSTVETSTVASKAAANGSFHTT